MNTYEEGVLRPSLENKEGYTHMSHAELRLSRTFNLLPKSISPFSHSLPFSWLTK